MRFLRKTLVRKLFFKFLILAILISSSIYLYFWNSFENVPFYYIPASLTVFLLFFMISYHFDVVQPLYRIILQMQALIAGKPYKKIYTTRIDEVGVIAHFFNTVTAGLGRATFDIRDRARMLDELTIASQLQRDILPKSNPSVPGLEIVSKTKPATELGGDSYNFLTSGGKTYIYIGDVTGHGAAAGLIMTMVNSLVTVFSDTSDSALEIIINVNRYIKKWVKQAMYMTMVILSWDHKKQILTYVGAGHEHVLVFRSATGKCEAILSGGVALGMVSDNSNIVKEKRIPLEKGDFVVLYSDGITEAKNEAGELYGLDRLKKAFSEYATQYSADGVNFHIAKHVSEFMGSHQQEDDMTLIVIKRDD